MYEPGDEIDIWVVEAPLGVGGMGSVYRCHNRSADRIKAAVKVIAHRFKPGTSLHQRFIREGEILYQLDHPNVVKVRNVRADHEPAYLEMEFVDGSPLDEMLMHGALDPALALELMTQLAGALSYLHGRNIRHRDIKPANLLVTEDERLVLVDFGLAIEADRTRITTTNTSFGTVAYAPPEWSDPERLDPERWDLYAMGVVAWELFTGNAAFPSTGAGSARQQALALMVAKQNHRPLDPGPGFPEDLRQLIRELTDSDVDHRLDSAAIAKQRFESIQGLPTTPPPSEMLAAAHETPAPATQASLPPARMFGGCALLSGFPVVAAAVAALGLAAWFFWFGVDGRPVEILVLGVPEDTSVQVRIDDQVGDRQELTFAFPELPLGTHRIRWASGKDCEPGRPAEHCDFGSAELEVIAGDGPQTGSVVITRPQRRPVSFDRHRWDAMQVDGVFARRGRATYEIELPPGPHTAVLTKGCPPSLQSCPPAGCPPGCALETVDFDVSRGRTRLRVEIPPTPGSTAAQPRPQPPRPGRLPPTLRPVPGPVPGPVPIAP